MDDPLISVVVPVRGDARLDRLLGSLDAQRRAEGAHEVIVVENGSSGLADVARRHGARYLHLERANPAAARNLGLAQARGGLVLMTDADCVAHPTWIRELVRALRSAGPDTGAVGGSIVKHRPTTLTQRGGITVVDGQSALNYLPAFRALRALPRVPRLPPDLPVAAAQPRARLVTSGIDAGPGTASWTSPSSCLRSTACAATCHATGSS